MATLDLDRLGNLLIVYGINFVGAILLAIIGWWIAGWAQRTVRGSLLASSRLDATVAGFLSSLTRYAVLVVTLLMILQLIGIEATSLIAVLGAASLAIGLALQGTLSNMAAGVMLLIFRPFKLGDRIEVAGKTGTVKDLNLFMTEIASGDNVQVLIPNNKVWGDTLINFSTYPTRRVSVTLPLPLESHISGISSAINGFLKSDPRVLGTPSPTVTIAGLKDKTIELSIAAWSRADDAAAVHHDLMRHVQDLLRSPQQEPPRL